MPSTAPWRGPQSGGTVAALVGRCPRSGGRFRHLRVRSRYAIAAGGVLPPALGAPAGIVIVMTGAIYFADRRMKTADNYFRGFPTLWNVAAFYLFVSAGALARRRAGGAARGPHLHAVQVPASFRVARLRMVSMGAVVLWALLAAYALVRSLEPAPSWLAGWSSWRCILSASGLPRSVDMFAFSADPNAGCHDRCQKVDATRQM